MSGNQRRLIRIQAVMACVMVALNLVLIPRWGITGAAVGAALTNAVSNVWYLKEVRGRLGLFPYSRSYAQLLQPLFGSLVVLLLLRRTFTEVHPEWIVIALGLVFGYSAFIGIALLFGLDAEDQFIAHTAWSLMRGVFQGAKD